MNKTSLLLFYNIDNLLIQPVYYHCYKLPISNRNYIQQLISADEKQTAPKRVLNYLKTLYKRYTNALLLHENGRLR